MKTNSAKPNTESDKSIDELKNSLVYSPTVYRDCKICNEPIPDYAIHNHDRWYSLLMDVIGLAETPVEVWDEKEKVSLAILKCDIRNDLRAEQRQKLNQLFGKEK